MTTEGNVTEHPDFGAWLDYMLAQHRLGPGCGSAECEGPDWREQVRWRMAMGYRPGLVSAFRDWQQGRP